jgi:hypothetical protein
VTWTFWQLYFAAVISAPTLWLGIAIGEVLAGLQLLAWLWIASLVGRKGVTRTS